MDNNWNEQTLCDLRIHELRDLARKIGVKCPTALRKEELAEGILKILSGDTAPYVASNKKGRPNKSGEYINKFVDAIMPQNFNVNEVNYILSNSDDDFVFMANQNKVEYGTGTEFITSGVVEVMAMGYAIVRVKDFYISQNDLFVSKQMVDGVGLVTGDYVKVEAKNFADNKPAVVTEVFAITKANSIFVASKKEFDKMSKISLTINNGANALEYFNDTAKADYNALVSAKQRQLLQSHTNTIYACITPFKAYRDVYTLFNTALSNSCKIASQCKVNVVIDCISDFYSAIEVMLSEQIDNSIKLQAEVKSVIFNLLEQLSMQGANVTIFDNENNKPHIQEFLQYDLSKICN